MDGFNSQLIDSRYQCFGFTLLEDILVAVLFFFLDDDLSLEEEWSAPYDDSFRTSLCLMFE